MKSTDDAGLAQAFRERIGTIEEQLEAGTYRTGSWADLLREIRAQPRPLRLDVAEDVSRASNALHRRAGHPEVSAFVGFGGAVVAAIASLVPLIGGADTQSNALALAGALMLAGVAQPLVKVTTGLLLGVRYAYAFLLGFEPRFKMQFGTYLSRPRIARVAYHLSGTLGTPLALALVSRQAALPPLTRTVSFGFALLFGAMNASFFLAALLGFSRFGPVRLAITSGGSAGLELRRR